MYAVIKTGGKQYRVNTGSIIRIEKINSKLGSDINFNDVLMCSYSENKKQVVSIGKPLVDKAKVSGVILSQGRGKKLVIKKKKRRKGYERTMGHRQNHVEVLITKINFSTNKSNSLSTREINEKKKKFFSLLKPKGAKPKISKQKPKADKIIKKTKTVKKATSKAKVSNKKTKVISKKTKVTTKKKVRRKTKNGT